MKLIKFKLNRTSLDDQLIKISIITPTLNSSKTLEKSILSVVNQSYTNIEYIILDGGSGDGTIEIIKKYSENIFYWKSEADDGIYDAMNKGIQVSTGNWLYFLGADDYLFSPFVIEKIVKVILKKKPDVVYGKVFTKHKILGNYLSDLMLIKKHICHQSIFFSKRVFAIHGKYDTKYRIAADRVFDLKWFTNKNIKKLFVKIIIAYYEIDGLSGYEKDTLFEQNKKLLYAKFFQKRLSRDIIENEGYYALEEMAYSMIKSKKYFKGILLIIYVAFLQRSHLPIYNGLYWLKKSLFI